MEDSEEESKGVFEGKLRKRFEVGFEGEFGSIELQEIPKDIG